MALVDGTTCGFCAVSPTSDPTGTGSAALDNYEIACKFTSPAGSNHVTEIGFYQNATNNTAMAYSCGIYTDSTGRASQIIATQSSGQSTTANTAGWYKYTGLNIPISASTIYWIAVAGPNVANANNMDYETTFSNRDYITPPASAPDYLTVPWSSATAITTRAYSIYAKYEADSTSPPAPAGLGWNLCIAGAWKAVSDASVVISGAWKGINDLQLCIGTTTGAWKDDTTI